jgi:hypothetical protein
MFIKKKLFKALNGSGEIMKLFGCDYNLWRFLSLPIELQEKFGAPPWVRKEPSRNANQNGSEKNRSEIWFRMVPKAIIPKIRHRTQNCSEKNRYDYFQARALRNSSAKAFLMTKLISCHNFSEVGFGFYLNYFSLSILLCSGNLEGDSKWRSPSGLQGKWF